MTVFKRHECIFFTTTLLEGGKLKGEEKKTRNVVIKGTIYSGKVLTSLSESSSL